ncbi:BamA/TamA family outer membrane protein [Geobacter chapellei]|uniref:BamA/TamA family outer membrane protein n=2 Tax=Pelotalea chapellei TaxID=44671 RepID=A0ABS5UAQ9_9BACT|nr:BamA/TamA family outer membrane protein [Pelotalea chapellei]MBT1072735.1 BamA/TamA family outer membrane protein [Pelotalea chapellei]
MLTVPNTRYFSTFSKLIVLGMLLCASQICGCTSYLQRDTLPILDCEDCAETVKVVTVPLPVIASSPNEGITTGALAAFLIHDKKDEINTLLAPQINQNTNFGITTSLYGAFYPAPNRNLEFNLSHSTKINYDYEARFKDMTLLKKKLDLNLFAFAFADGSARFYGFNAKSPQQEETNYTDQEIGYNLAAGFPIGEHFQVVIGDRLRDVEIRRGAVKKLPYTGDEFTVAQVPGLKGFTAHTLRLSLIYSTLDNRDTPTRGGYAKLSVEPSFKELGGVSEYRHYEAEFKGYIPLDNARYISIFRLMYNQTLGGNVPFLEQSILGGESSLRGYGRNRFIDNSFFLCNLEERIRLFRWEIFNVTADWEIAPFVDLGAVMESLDKANLDNFEFNPGIGFRAIVRPNIVGRVDMGIGRSGPAIFVGLGYPF